MKRQLVNLRLPPELVARVDARAEQLGQTRTKYVERALDLALTEDLASPEPYKLPPSEPSPKPAAPRRRAVSRQEPVQAVVRPGTPSAVPGVQTARDLAMAKQAELNKAKKP